LTDAHHVKPWFDGGDTCLGNLVLMCRHHHALVEPPKDRPANWLIQFREDGLPEFIPPGALDPERRPILHQRFILAGAEPTAICPRICGDGPGMNATGRETNRDRCTGHDQDDDDADIPGCGHDGPG
jgi:hypothetical protein